MPSSTPSNPFGVEALKAQIQQTLGLVPAGQHGAATAGVTSSGALEAGAAWTHGGLTIGGSVSHAPGAGWGTGWQAGAAVTWVF